MDNQHISVPVSGAITPDVRDLLQALYDALAVPSAQHHADERAQARLLERRAGYAVAVLAAVLKDGGLHTSSIDLLREWTEQSPVMYTPWQRAAQGGGAR